MKEKKNVSIEYICVELDGKKQCIGLNDLAELLSKKQDDISSNESCCGPNCC